MPHPDDALTIRWLNQEYGPKPFHASLIPYTDIAVKFTDFACVYADEPKSRWIEMQQERRSVFGGNPTRLPNINKRKAARMIRDYIPSDEWSEQLKLHRSVIRQEFSRAKTDEALLRIVQYETVGDGLPMAMMSFGITTPKNEPVAILCCHRALRIDHALALLNETWEYLA